MPLPKPRPGENQNDYVSRCIEFETKASPDRPPDQVEAMCYQSWRDRNKESVEQAVSNAPWDTVDKSKLPAACFLWVEDPKKKATWHLPVYMGAGGIDPKAGMYKSRGALNLNALRAALAAIGGARTGKHMNVPSSVRSRLNALAKQHKIGQGGAESQYKEFACEVSLKEATFDIAEDHVGIRNVVLLGAESKNKRKYMRDAMEKAEGLYGNVRAFANHQEESGLFSGNGPDVMMLAGKFTNPRFDTHELKIRADFEGLDAKDPVTQKFVRIAQNMPDIAGFSHNAKGKIRVEDGIEIVEEIKEVFSVDLVAYPATTSGIFESEENKMDYSDVTILGLKENRPDLTGQLHEEGQKSRDDEVQQLIRERDGAVKKADELQAAQAVAEKQALVDKLFSESELPEEAKTDVFRKLLLNLRPANAGETIEAQAKEMIDDRLAAISGKGQVKNNTERKTTESAISIDEAAEELRD